MASAEANTLVALLGWDMCDFENAAKHATREALIEAIDILKTTGSDETPRERELSKYGSRFCEALLNPSAATAD